MTVTLPYAHPTTVLLVDDEQSFLKSWLFLYSDQFLCEASASPERALELLRRRSRPIVPESALMVPHTHDVDPTAGKIDFQVDPAAIAQTAQMPDRFGIISVVIIDYAMPGMTGLDLCQQLGDLPVCRILLTGKATEKTAIDGFNAGLIDRFLVKQDRELPQRLAVEIETLQAKYFSNVSKPLRPVDQHEDTRFLSDERFALWFRAYCRDNGIVEHYLRQSPPGLTLIEQHGQVVELVVCTTDYRRAQLEIAQELNAPSELLNMLREGRHVGLFPGPAGYYDRCHESDWQRYVKPIQDIGSDLAIALASEPFDGSPAPIGECLATYRRRMGEPTLH